MRRAFPLITCVLAAALLAASATRDGAVIVNTGSTNTAGYTIEFWSDGTGLAKQRGAPATPFSMPPAATERFFQDVKAARADGRQLQHCMKSASFGSRTIVRWHGWVSPDFQCPPFTQPVAALAQDVNAIISAAHVRTTPGMRRVRLPGDLRKIPTPTPEVTPT